jgi:carbon-monoxide dehydrogenase small subunit
MTLADFLRHELNLTGTHVGCEHGVCGACTVLVDGRSARACLMLAVQCDGGEVTTVESLAENGKLNTLQDAFQEFHGLQCGFCTPGRTHDAHRVSSRQRESHRSRSARSAERQLCRCTGYQGMVDAALAAAKRMRSGV